MIIRCKKFQIESKELLDQHLAQPHLTAFGEKAGELLDGPFDIKILEIPSYRILAMEL